jgi:transposase
MQGKKDYQEELFTNFQLSEFVPEENLYRRLKGILQLDYLYARTKPYYGNCGQKSIDPVVFFKLCLVGYLENIISDRQLMQHCSMRLDIRYFLNYKLTEPLPWHSTMSRTRDLLPEALFKEVFEEILRQCINAGLVSGHTQVVDSAPVKANASMDSLELKVPKEDLDDHLARVRYQSAPDRAKHTPKRKAQQNKATEQQQSITATDRELKEITARNKNWQKSQDQRPGAQRENSKYTSNKTHYSPTDPDARISVKPGKARKLNYLSQLAVDPASYVITHIGADYADKHDSRCLPQIVDELQTRLNKMGLTLHHPVGRYGLQQWRELCIIRRERHRGLYTTPWHLQRRAGRFYLSWGRRLLAVPKQPESNLPQNVYREERQQQKETLPDQAQPV